MSNIGDSLVFNLSNSSNSAEIYADVPLYLKVLASIFYSISMLLGFGGNTLVLLIAFYYDRTRTVTNFFIINLAISDLVFVLLCIPSTYITAYLLQYWPFSNVLCIFFNYMQTVSVTLTVYTLIWITLDKFWALVRPFKLRMTIKECKYLILFSWIFSLFISLPIALFTRLNTVSNEINIEISFSSNSSFNKINSTSSEIKNPSLETIESRPQCAENWPTSLQVYHIAQLYNILLLLIQYFIPLIILAFCYARIGFVLKKQKTPGESIKRRDDKMVESKKKILKMCFMMVLTFMMFWAPLQFLNVYRFYDENISYSKHFGDLFFVCHIIAVSRSFVNPIIYAWTNIRFRHGLKYFICCFCFDENKKHIKHSTTTNRNQTSELIQLKPSLHFKSKHLDENSKRASKTFIEMESPISMRHGSTSRNITVKGNITTYAF